MKTSFRSLGFVLARQALLALALAATALADNHPPVAVDDPVTGAGPLSAQGGSVLFPLPGNRLHYTPPAGFVGPDSFSYTVSDGHGGGATAQVLVLVLSANLPSRNVVGVTVTPGGMRARFVGVPGRAYLVQRSTDLTVWTTMATRTAPINLVFEYLDDNPPPSAFYRAILP